MAGTLGLSFDGIRTYADYVLPSDPMKASFGYGLGVTFLSLDGDIGLDFIGFMWGRSIELFDYDLNFDYSDYVLKVHLRYVLPMERFRPYAGIGMGYHSYHWEYGSSMIN